jgi:hypothetical protein
MDPDTEHKVGFLLDWVLDRMGMIGHPGRGWQLWVRRTLRDMPKCVVDAVVYEVLRLRDACGVDPGNEAELWRDDPDDDPDEMDL